MSIIHEIVKLRTTDVDGLWTNIHCMYEYTVQKFATHMHFFGLLCWDVCLVLKLKLLHTCIFLFKALVFGVCGVAHDFKSNNWSS